MPLLEAVFTLIDFMMHVHPHTLRLTEVYGLLAILGSVSLSGCESSNKLQTAEVTGRVTIDGRPLSMGTVMFVPEHGKMATGRIESNGTFRLSTYGSNDGVIVGKCRAAVMVITSAGEENELEPARPSPIPAKYSAVGTSGLEYEVKAGETNLFHLDLKSS